MPDTTTPAEALLRSVIDAYRAYRRRGVAPAPNQYGDLVRAIEMAEAALAAPAEGQQPAEPGQRWHAGWLVSNSEGDEEFINNETALQGRHYKGGAPLALSASFERAAPRPGHADGFIVSERVVPPEIAKIARNLHTQDNRITYNPLFAVQQKRRIYGLDVGYCDNAEWILDGETWTPEDGEEPPADARKVGYIDIWEFVTGGFTEQGCKDYIAANGHNLREPRIYAYGSYRKAQPDMRHPKIQALIGSKARREIELRIAEDLLDDPAHEISGTDGDYWLPLHDKIVALQQQAQPAHADGRASDLAAELRECREALKFAESKLTNMQPHIEQACYPGRAKFIDNYVDPVIDRIRAVRAKGGAA